MKYLGLLTLILLCGCNVKTADAPRVPLVINDRLTVQDFEPQNIAFTQAQLFLWKKDAPGGDVAQVLKYSALIETTQAKIYDLGLQRPPMKERFDTLFADHRAKCKAQVEADAKAAGKSEEETAAEVEKKCLVHDIVSLPGQEDALKDKRKEIAKVTEEMVALQKLPPSPETDKQIEKLAKKIRRFEDAMAPTLEALMILTDEGQEGTYSAWKSLEKEIAENTQLATDYLEPINETVWIFNSSPIKFNFVFASNRSIQASIQNWDLSQIQDPEVAEAMDSKEFSTAAFTMDKVTYAKRGGVFTFEVHSPAAVYWFKIARNRYGAVDGLVHYKGDIVRCSVSNGYGRPVVVHIRDFVQCGVNTDFMDLAPEEVGHPEMRRGAAKLDGEIVLPASKTVKKDDQD